MLVLADPEDTFRIVLVVHHEIMPVCRQYMEGECRYDPCRFVHDDTLCYDHWKHGVCSAAACSMSHPDSVRTPRDNRKANGATSRRLETDPSTKGATQPKDQSSVSRGKSSQNAQRPDRGPRSNRRAGQRTVDEYDADSSNEPVAMPRGKGMSKLPMPKVNTENFEPSHEPCTMRVVIDLSSTRLSVKLAVRDVLCAPCIFNRPGDASFYDELVKEIQSCGVHEDRLLKSWHGDSHWIADDTTGWKKNCPTFNEVVSRLKTFFSMDVKATRFNWYKDTSEWKPYHFDAAAVKPDKARTQNFTVGVSFGATRDAAFECAKTKTTVCFPQPNGYVYCFSRDTNILWRHGILQETTVRSEGRISIILWGWVDQEEC